LIFLTYSTQRDLREKLYNSYIKRGDNDNEKDNKDLAIKMADLRLQRSNVLGYKSHADFVLEDTMAKNTGRVKNLLDQVWKPGLARAKIEAEEMQQLIQQEGGNFKLAAWDWWHY
jgi:peptidyl-dipeptidase Dcp